MAWDYADLSKAAKAVGGPEMLVNSIEENAKSIGYAEGQTSMIPWIGIAAVVASFFTGAVIEVRSYIKAKKAISQTAVYDAKAELVKEITAYDAEHPDASEDSTHVKGDENDE